MVETHTPDEPRRIVPEPSPDETAPRADDSNDPAIKEALQLSSGKTAKELEEEALKREHERDQKFRDHFELLAIAAMYVLFASLCVFGFVWVLHMILPEQCQPTCWWHVCCVRRWLTSDQVTILQDIITGGVIGGLLADHFRKRLNR
jgi:hypothetical protein